jgi:hypothetical protein
VLAVPLSFALAGAAGAAGAAAACVTISALAATAFGVLLSRRFGGVVPVRPLGRIALAGGGMFAACALAPDDWHFVASSAAGLAVYGAALLLLSEVTWGELSAIVRPRPLSR